MFCWDQFLLLDATYCDLDQIRTGSVTIGMAKGMGWENFNAEHEERLAAIFDGAYPVNEHSFYLVDAPTMIGAMLKVCELFYAKESVDKAKMVTLDDLYSKLGFTRDELPPDVGGTYVQDLGDWTMARLWRRSESVRLVTLPP